MTYNADRLWAWLKDLRRKPPHLEFTSGPDREVADMIWDAMEQTENRLKATEPPVMYCEECKSYRRCYYCGLCKQHTDKKPTACDKCGGDLYPPGCVCPDKNAGAAKESCKDCGAPLPPEAEKIGTKQCQQCFDKWINHRRGI